MFQGEITIESSRINEVSANFRGVKIYRSGDIFVFRDSFAAPGFFDAHGHLFGLGVRLASPNLTTAKSAEECAKKMKNLSLIRRGDWIVGGGWNQELWSERNFPSAAILDAEFPDAPVSLRRIDGHALWANSKAMELAGIAFIEKSPPGGKIVRDKRGRPTGIFVDSAMELIEKHIPAIDAPDKFRAINSAAKELLRLGVVEIRDMDVSLDIFELLRSMALSNRLPIKSNVYLRADGEFFQSGIVPHKIGNLNVCGLKYFIDGALGSRGAALYEPYEDAPDESGLILTEPDDFFKSAARGCELGFQIAAHAIGDLACGVALDCFERLRKRFPNAILSIEHAQILTEKDIERIARLGVIVSLQPLFCVSDAEMARKRLGESRLKRSYLWKTLLDNGIKIAAGSDFPIESHNPLYGVDAFVRRIPPGFDDAFFGEERLDAKTAFDIYTRKGRESFGFEGGEIAPNAPADFAIFRENIMNMDPEKIAETKPAAVFVGGKLKYVDPDYLSEGFAPEQ